MPGRSKSKRLSWITGSLLIAAAVAMTVFFSGCRQELVEVVRVEETDGKSGQNLAPVRDKIREDAERNIELWIEGDSDKLPEAFTENMMGMWRQGRNLDKEEGVKRIRVHSDQEYTPSDMTKARPQLIYDFMDESYFVDEATGEPTTKPYNVERTLVMFLIEEDGRYKIDNMVGNADALR